MRFSSSLVEGEAWLLPQATPRGAFVTSHTMLVDVSDMHQNLHKCGGFESKCEGRHFGSLCPGTLETNDALVLHVVLVLEQAVDNHDTSLTACFKHAS